MPNAVLYIHGKGGSAEEATHYKGLFPGGAVFGLDYAADTPWDAGAEIREAVQSMADNLGPVTLIANSIGAYFSMHAGVDALVQKACFISPIVDMESLIGAMLTREGVTEERLRREGVIRTNFGETLSWDYLQFVRTHPIEWHAPTAILYGMRDALTPYDTMAAFAQKINAGLTVMQTGEHWFHTDEQMAFLDTWITSA